MTPANPHQKIELRVHETTDEKPDYKIQMRHVYAIAREEGVRVMDVMVVQNPADRAWLGTADANGERSAVWVQLPAGAKDIEMEGGFHACCARVEDGKITSTAALVPGQTQFRVAYLLEPKDGKLEMAIHTPAPVGGMMLMVPEDQTGQITVTGLQRGQSFRARGDGMLMRSYTGRGLMPGQVVNLAVAELPQAAAEEGFWSGPKVIGIVGGVIVLLLCIVFLAARPARKAGGDERESPKEETAT
jgi:hypothetical protein